MSDARLKGMKVAILSTDGFEQSELTEPKRLLAEAGAEVEVIAPEQTRSDGEILGWDKTDWGQAVKVDRKLADANPDDYDALVLPGGQINPDKLRLEDRAIKFIKQVGDADKPVAAICHGPWTLINAGLVKGRRMTSWPSVRIDLANAGAQWQDSEVVVDGNFITSRNPGDIPAFVKALGDLMASRVAEPHAA